MSDDMTISINSEVYVLRRDADGLQERQVERLPGRRVDLLARQLQAQRAELKLAQLAGLNPEQFEEFGPDVLERVLPSPPGPGGERFAGQPRGVPVFPSRLGVHTHLESRKREGQSVAEKLAKLWKKDSPYDAKVMGGALLRAGKKLPIRP